MIENYALTLSNLPSIDAIQTVSYTEKLTEVNARLNAETPTLLNEDLQPVHYEAEITESNGRYFWSIPVDKNQSRYYLDLPITAMGRQAHITAYHEIRHQQQFNEAVKSVMVATATGGDLDNLALREGLTRFDNETDDQFRKRIILKPESLAQGTAGSYVFHSLNADSSIKQAIAISPVVGEVVVYLLNKNGNGFVDAETLAVVDAYLNEPDRNAFDDITVLSAEIIEYQINIDLVFYSNSDQAQIIAAIVANYASFKEQNEIIGSSIDDLIITNQLLCGNKFKQITFNSSVSVQIGAHQAPFCTQLVINGEVVA